MAYGYPLRAESVLPVPAGKRKPLRGSPPAVAGSWRYLYLHRSRPMLATAMAASASLHLVVLFGIQQSAPAPKPAASSEWIALTIPPPQIKDLEDDPEPIPRDPSEPVLDLTPPVPMQADLPALARPDDFVQALDMSSLIERPDLRDSRITVIPEHITRGVDLRQRIGAIFNLNDLDRPPEPVVQPAPVFPFNLKREAVEGRVRVEFVVDSEGRVHHPFVIESSHPGFDEAACTGVARWKFRPGIKNGRKVNTRMQVPIVFKIVDDTD